MRKINIRLLLVSGIVYRLHIIVVETVLFRMLTGKWQLALTASLLSNLVTMVLYYNYHYWFARLFRIGNDSMADG